MEVDAANFQSMDDDKAAILFVADENKAGTGNERQLQRKLSDELSMDVEPRAAVSVTIDSENTLYTECLFISSFAVLGATLRVFMGRLFGADCELGADAVQDVFTPFFQGICVTAGGRSMQTGGALFRDMPANMLGSFLMGIVTSKSIGFFFPWFHKGHHLQKYKPFQTGHGIGFCGSLTTFAAWNAQMVIMMDGTYTELGPQIIPALVGYILGMMTCVISFRIGSDFAEQVHFKWGAQVETETPTIPLKDTEDLDNWYALHSDTEIQSSNSHTMRIKNICRPMYLIHVLSLFTIIILYIGTQVHNDPFYEKVTMAAIAAPLGALCRWKLSKLNDNQFLTRFPMPWLPWGTLAANVIAALISVTCQGVTHRYLEDWDGDDSRWTEAIFFAVQFGFAGSLSTVSTLVKEIVALDQKETNRSNSYLYGAVTCFSGMALGLALYMLIVRS